MKKSQIALLMALALLLTGCGKAADGTNATGESQGAVLYPEGDAFSNRDLNGTFEANDCTVITFSGDGASCTGSGVEISGSTVTITKAGEYLLTGTLDDGMVIVNTDKSDKTQLVLDGVSIHSQTCAPIYILQADKVFITLAEGTENTLSNGGSFTAIDENNIDAVIFSKEDVTLNGTGSLTFSSPGGHGIVSKDSLTVTGGTYEITAASHGLSGKDDVSIVNASFAITAGKDGIHADNDEDTEKGFVYIECGSFSIEASGDGISASGAMQILGDNFEITAGGGSANGDGHTSQGGFGGGGRPGGRMEAPGQMPTGAQGSTPLSSTTVTGTGDSRKGIKAAGNLSLQGGSFTIDSADDGIHSNADILISGGTFRIATGDDGVHADENLSISGGNMEITQSYEGLEALHLNISGGSITLTADDDGLNAAGGADESGFGGFFGGDRFGGKGGMGGGSSNGTIVISGGTIQITASGDGIDANGSLEISGGLVTVCGPTQGDTSTLDYDTTGIITGGTFIGTGASGMAQSFSGGTQGVIAVNVGNQSAGTEITLTDGDGNVLLSHTPWLSFAVVIFSSPELTQGQTYTLTVGTLEGEVTAR